MRVCAVVLRSAAITGEFDYITFRFVTMKREMLCCLAPQKNPDGINQKFCLAVTCTAAVIRHVISAGEIAHAQDLKDCFFFCQGTKGLHWLTDKRGQHEDKVRLFFYTAWFYMAKVKTLFHIQASVCKAKPHTSSNSIL